MFLSSSFYLSTNYNNLIQIQTTTSRADLNTLVCEYGDDTFDSINVYQDINNPSYKISFGNIPFSITNTENLNISTNADTNRFILANTEFTNDVLLNSIDILPSKIGFVTLYFISFQFQCIVSCYNQLQQLNSNILDSRYKLSANLTLELKNLSLHTFYFSNSQIPLLAGNIFVSL